MNDIVLLEIPELLAKGLSAQRPFTIDQARRAGVSRKLLRRLVDEGTLRRIFRGVYVDNASGDTPHLRAQALSLVLPRSAVAVDHTAAWLCGVDTFSPSEQVIPPPLNIYRVAGSARIRREGCAGGERQLSPYDVTTLGHIQSTTPLRTALDLGRSLPRERALAAMDGLARAGSFDKGRILASIDRFKGFRGVVQLRSLAPVVDPLAESPGESRLRLAWIDADLPRPLLQHAVVADGRIAYLDICDPRTMFAAEYDGEQWHTSAQQITHDRDRRAWLAQLGWHVSVFTRQDFYPDSAEARRRLRREYAARQRAVR